MPENSVEKLVETAIYGIGRRGGASHNRRQTRSHEVLVLGALFLNSPLLFAQQAATSDHIEELVVSGQYISSGAASAMKLDIPVLDTPFSVANYTNSFMKSIETSNVSDLYKYMTGIQRAGTTGYDMSIRGFKTGVNDRNAIMVDGLPGLVSRLGSNPTIGTDHIEVVKGPASVLYGQAQPGGFVNLVTKKPQATRSSWVAIKANSFLGDKLKFGDASGYSFSIDSTGPIDPDKRFLYRFVAENIDGDTFRDFGYERALYLAPSLTWNVTTATLATLSIEYRGATSAYDKYLVAPNKNIGLVAPITTLYQEPGDYQRETANTTSLAVQHEFDGGAKWSFGWRYVHNRDQSAGYDPVAVRPDLVTLQRRARRLDGDRTYAYADSNLVVPFDTGPVKHKAIFGINGGRDENINIRRQFFNGTASGPQSLDVAVYNPVHGVAPPLDSLPLVNPATPGNLNVPTPRSRSRGVYVADLMTLSKSWKLNLGLRYSQEGQRIQDTLLNRTTIKDSSKALPLGGILYQPDERWTYYASYSTSFVPATPTAIDVNGNNPFKPTEGAQLEFGAKADLFEGRIQPTLSFFNIKRKNVLGTFSCPLGTCSEQIGGESSKGFEFEVSAQPIDNWLLALGVSHITPKVTASTDAAQVGARLQNAAENNAHVWSRYDLKTGPLKHLGFGAGLSYISERSGNLPSTADRRVMILPGYTVADLAIYYVLGPVDLTLKIANIFDKHYYESTGQTAEVQVQPGLPRNIVLSARMSF